MTTVARFSYEPDNGSRSQGSLLARLPITLDYKDRSITIAGLLDSGSTVNVLPYGVGLELGLDWEEQTVPVVLTGSLGNLPARGVVLQAQVSLFPRLNLLLPGRKRPKFPYSWDRSTSSWSLRFVSFERKRLLR